MAKLATGFYDVAVTPELVCDGEAAITKLTTLIDPLILIPVSITVTIASVAALATQ
ncbi:hypothetical protein [Pantoea agglomerans]|uniref:hypothetical protein n=1 Tax=Enterobacter agglomerans TaxID=549 RepID=UPI0024132067|nr:hypothetical protein [Pantoea agglomerans]